ncbi:MAG: preprotein translocase subunit SecY, partial [Phycisphaerales bacterium]
MLQAILNIFKIPDLRNKVLFTIGMLAVYRIGFWIPVQGIDLTALAELMQRQSTDGKAAGRVLDFVQI